MGSDSMEHSSCQGWSMVRFGARIVSYPAGKLRNALACAHNLNVPGRRSQGITQPQGPLHADVACPEVVYQD